MIETDAILTSASAAHTYESAAAFCSRCAELERKIAKLKEELDWQNMPNRREPFRGGWEFYINEEWTCIRDAETAGYTSTPLADSGRLSTSDSAEV